MLYKVKEGIVFLVAVILATFLGFDYVKEYPCRIVSFSADMPYQIKEKCYGRYSIEIRKSVSQLR